MVNKCFILFIFFIKSLENEEEKEQIIIWFLEDIDFTNETELGYFFNLRRFVVILKLS